MKKENRLKEKSEKTNFFSNTFLIVSIILFIAFVVSALTFNIRLHLIHNLPKGRGGYVNNFLICTGGAAIFFFLLHAKMWLKKEIKHIKEAAEKRMLSIRQTEKETV